MKFFFLTLALFFLTACSNAPGHYMNNPVIANLTDEQQAILAYIETTGIQVIKQGMRFTFVIPDDAFFSRRTRALKESREKDIDTLARFIRSYMLYFEHPKVTVTGYSDVVFLEPERNKLSKQFADTIADYLREDGISSDLITVKGEGANHSIGSNCYPMGSAFNRRVEIVID